MRLHVTSIGINLYAYDVCYLSNIADLSLIECYETVECTNSTSRMVTPADCCLRPSSGLAYIKPGSDKCYVCIGNLFPV